jgi:CobQ-like glutamine amidotransferase family enzyme
MAELSILHLYPHTLRLNGEAGNVTALSVRGASYGLKVKTSVIEISQPLPTKRPDIIFLGSGTLSATKLAAEDLVSKSQIIHLWVAQGTKVLAVGSGFDLVSQGLELLDGTFIAGLGLTNTTHKIEAQHQVGEVLLSGGLAGFVNTNRSIRRGSGSFEIGKVTASDLPSLVGYVDGYFDGKVMASNVQGPLLPMNPKMADEIFAQLFPKLSKPAALRKLDQLATKARAAISARVGR